MSGCAPPNSLSSPAVGTCLHELPVLPKRRKTSLACRKMGVGSVWRENHSQRNIPPSALRYSGIFTNVLFGKCGGIPGFWEGQGSVCATRWWESLRGHPLSEGWRAAGAASALGQTFPSMGRARAGVPCWAAYQSCPPLKFMRNKSQIFLLFYFLLQTYIAHV